MGGPGAAVIGLPIVNTTTGSNVTILPRSGQLLGFFTVTISTITFYDWNGSGSAPSQLFSIAFPAGPAWIPMPIDLVNGLVINSSAGQQIWVVQ